MEPAAPPTWLDKGFVEELLREKEGNHQITVQQVAVELAVGKGDNYMSQLHRVSVHFNKDGKTELRSLIVKSLLDGEFMAKLVAEGGFFTREKRMYEVTLPALCDLEEPVIPLYPSFYKSSRPNTLVMEDLAQQGYKMVPRHQGLDLDHCKVALTAFARLHALSLALLAREPTSMDQYEEPFHKEAQRETNTQFINPLINTLAGRVEKWVGFERFGEKLRAVDWVDLGIRLARVEEGDIAVLNHGDGWINNMLFQYDQDSGLVTGFRFVDFQISRFASPALDLHYFLHTSPSEETREKHWDELIDHYYHTLVQVLNKVDCEAQAFSYDQLKKEIRDKMMFGLMTACTILGIVLVDPEDTPEMVNFTEDNVEQQMEASNIGNMYDGKLFKKVFGNMLLRFESMGLI